MKTVVSSKWRFLSAAIGGMCALVSPLLPAEGQGRPQTAWMRAGHEGSYYHPPAYSPDGRFIAVDENGWVAIYRAGDGILLHMIRHNGIVGTNHPAPGHWGFLPDGRLLKMDDGYVPAGTGVTYYNTVIIFDANTFQPVETFPAPTPVSPHFDIAPDGQHAILNGNIVRLIDRAIITLPYYPVFGFDPPFGDYHYARRFAPDGSVIANWRSPHHSYPWLATLGGARLYAFRPENGFASYFTPYFRPDFGAFTLGYGAGLEGGNTVFAWPPNSQGNCPELYGRNADKQAAWSPDGTLFAVNGSHIEGILNALTGVPVWERSQLNGRGSWLRFSPDMTALIAAPINFSPYVRTLSPADGSEIQRLSWQVEGGARVRLSPDGSRIAVATETGGNTFDTGIQVWNTATGALVRHLTAGNGVSAILMAGNDILIVGHRDQAQVNNSLQAYDVATGTILWSRSFGGRGVANLSLSPNGMCLAGEDLANRTEIFHPATGAVIQSLSIGQGLEFSPDGLKIAKPNSSGVQIFNLQGAQIGSIGTDIRGDGVAWSPDSRKILVWGHVGLCIGDAVTGTINMIQQVERPITGAWSADGKTLLVSYEQRLVIYDAVTFNELRSYTDFVGSKNRSGIFSLQFLPDNQFFAFGHLCGTVGMAHNPSASPVAKVSGTLRLPGRSPAAPVVPLSLTFTPADNSGDILRTVWVDASGAFAVPGLPRQPFTVTVRADYALTEAFALDLTAGDITDVNVTLRAADANGDNAVDIGDLLILIAHYNQQNGVGNYLEACDFNGDDFNDIADLLILIGIYNQLGD
jgi:WD40 repeat protein